MQNNQVNVQPPPVLAPVSARVQVGNQGGAQNNRVPTTLCDKITKFAAGLFLGVCAAAAAAGTIALGFTAVTLASPLLVPVIGLTFTGVVFLTYWSANTVFRGWSPNRRSFYLFPFRSFSGLNAWRAMPARNNAIRINGFRNWFNANLRPTRSNKAGRAFFRPSWFSRV